MLDPANSKLTKHSVTIAGHRTSITLESVFWKAFQDIAKARGVSINELVRQLDEARSGGLSSAIRVFVLDQESRINTG